MRNRAVKAIQAMCEARIREERDQGGDVSLDRAFEIMAECQAARAEAVRKGEIKAFMDQWAPLPAQPAAQTKTAAIPDEPLPW